MLAHLLTAGTILLAQAGTPRDPTLLREVGRLVRQLDDDAMVERQAAEEALTAMGPDVLGLLPPITPRTSPEVKARLERVRTALQTELSRRFVDATHVTLRGRLGLVEVCESFWKQTGNEIAGFQDLPGEVDVDFQAVPFWAALDQVLDQAQLTIDPFAGRRRTLVLVPRPQDQLGRSGRACYRGAFRFEPTRVTAARDLLDPRIAGLRVRLAVSWEPRLAPIALTQPLSLLSARDDLDRPIAADGTTGRLSASVESDVTQVEMELPLQLPDRGARRIASLKGTLLALLPGRVEEFRFSGLDGTADVRQRRAGVAVTLRRVLKSERISEVQLRIQFDEAANALESHRGWILKNPAYLVDSAGQRLEHEGQRLLDRDASGIDIAYQFAPPRALSDYTFVYETPTLILQREIPFELKDIDLP